MTAPTVRVGRGRPGLWLLAWIVALGSVVGVAVAGRGDAPVAEVVVAAETRQADASAAIASPAAEPDAAALRLVAPSEGRPVPGDGLLHIVALGETGTAERVVAQVLDGDRVVARSTVPVTRRGVVRGWLRLEPAVAARPLRLRLTREGVAASLAETPFVQLGARPIVLTAPALPDQAANGERLVVSGRLAAPAPNVVIRLATDTGVLASQVAPVLADGSGSRSPLVFRDSIAIPADVEPGRLWVTVLAVGVDRAVPATRISVLRGLATDTHAMDGTATAWRVVGSMNRPR